MFELTDTGRDYLAANPFDPDDYCSACDRPSLDCSRAPCAAVVADREAVA